LPSHRFASLYSKAAKRFAEDGVLRGSAHILRKFTRKVIRYDCIYLYSIPANHALPSAPISTLPSLAIRVASRKAIVRFERGRTRDSAQYVKKASEGLERVKTGQKCFVAMDGERTIGKAWVAEKESWYISEVETDEPIGPGAILIFDCATIPEYRGRGIYPAILRHIAKAYPNRRKIIYCEKENVSSRRGIEREFRLEKRMYLFKILGANIRWTRMAEAIGGTATSSGGEGGGAAAAQGHAPRS
jgi:hypothetical protein